MRPGAPRVKRRLLIKAVSDYRACGHCTCVLSLYTVLLYTKYVYMCINRFYAGRIFESHPRPDNEGVARMRRYGFGSLNFRACLRRVVWSEFCVGVVVSIVFDASVISFWSLGGCVDERMCVIGGKVLKSRFLCMDSW